MDFTRVVADTINITVKTSQRAHQKASKSKYYCLKFKKQNNEIYLFLCFHLKISSYNIMSWFLLSPGHIEDKGFVSNRYE